MEAICKTQRSQASLRGNLPDGEGEVGVGEGLVAKREVPPLGVECLEAVGEHGAAEYHAMGKLLGRDAAAGGTLAVVARVLAGLGVAAEVGMALGTEPVEGAAHVEFLLGLHVEEGEVDGGAARVAALLVDVFLFEEDAFVEVGIEIGLHLSGLQVGSPAHEVVDGFLRPVGVVDFQAVALRADVVAHGSQCLCCLLCEEGCRFLVAVDALSHEVVRAEVTYLEDGIGNGIGQGDELAVVVGRRKDCRGIAFALDGGSVFFCRRLPVATG